MEVQYAFGMFGFSSRAQSIIFGFVLEESSNSLT